MQPRCLRPMLSLIWACRWQALAAWLLLVTIAATPHVAARAADPAQSARAQEGGAELAAGRFERARAIFDDVLSAKDVAGERRASLLNDRGVALWRLGNLPASVEDFNAAISLVPEFAVAYNNRGNVLLALNNAQEAIKDFDRALLLAPKFVGALNNRAIAYMQLDQPDLAIADFSKAAELAPGAPAPLNGRGRAQLALGKPFAAIRDFNRAVALEPGYRPGLRNRVQVRLDLEQYDSAIAALGEALGEAPDDIQMLLMRAKANARVRKPIAALKDLSRVLELAPDNITALTERGGMYGRLSEADAAMKDLDRAIALDPRNALAMAYRGAALRAAQPDVGLTEVEAALKLEPKNATALRIRGELREVLAGKDAAIADFRKSVAIDPAEQEAWIGLERLTGETRPEPTLVSATDVRGWRIYQRAPGRYVARSENYEKLEVPLEVLGDGPPEITDWSIRKDLKGIGVLRYLAGKVVTKGKTEEVELAAVIDLWRADLRGIEPWRQGARLANWSWNQNGQLEVKSAEGLSTLALRGDRDGGSRVAATSTARSSVGGRGQVYTGQTSQRRTIARRDPPRRKSKSLFELLFSF